MDSDEEMNGSDMEEMDDEEMPETAFRTSYSCYSVAMLPGHDRVDVDRGGKIILPPSALHLLSRMNIDYPMLFKLENPLLGRITHCGVLEFVADEGKVYLPLWMMENLMLEIGGHIIVESASLPVASFTRFQPQSMDFLDISDPKAVLENSLRFFACLTTGDVINIRYNEKDYQIAVLETEPGAAVRIIECDMNVEFAPPWGYEEFQPDSTNENDEEDLKEFVAFRSTGHRLDGKEIPAPLTQRKQPLISRKGIPDYEWKVGTLIFNRSSK